MAFAAEVHLDLGPELASFRSETRQWIAEHAPPGLAEMVDWYEGSSIHTASNRDPQREARLSDEYLSWDRVLTENRLIYPHWPQHAGGAGWSDVESAIFAEECFRAGVPRIKRGFGADLVSTAILIHGTREQQQRFLPRIVDGVDRYCQGFSEPDHGSDLGAIETVGVVEGDELVVTGKKIWTSEFDAANMIFLLCRTDSDAPRNEALTFVILPFDSSNRIVARGIRQMTGAADFAEDFFDGARAPLANVIGGIGRGWEVAMDTLATERTIDLQVMHLGYAHDVSALFESARKRSALTDSGVRQRIASAFIDTLVMRAQGYEVMEHAGQGRGNGELASISKLFWSEHSVRMGELAMDIEADDGITRPAPESSKAAAIDATYAVSRWQDLFLTSRAAPIFSGSNEIQRNIIAERVLKLPREPRGMPATPLRLASGGNVR